MVFTTSSARRYRCDDCGVSGGREAKAPEIELCVFYCTNSLAPMWKLIYFLTTLSRGLKRHPRP